MILGNPGALWWLLLIPLVVLLYMLRARRESRLVPSTLLWERAVRDLVARMPVRRLERSLLLLLQILAIAVLALALARPSVMVPGLAGDAVVLVIRTTASMQATDVAPSRLAAAKRQARDLLAHLGPRQPAALVAAGAAPALVRDFTVERGSLVLAVEALRATDAGGALDDAVALASSLRVDGRPGRVHVFSDRAPADRRATWHPVGRGAPNMAISWAIASPVASGGTRLLVRVQTFGGAVPARTLRVAINGRALAARRVQPAPGEAQVAVFDLGRATGLVTAWLEGQDALPADDRAVVAVGRGFLPGVLVVGGPNPVLDAVWQAVPVRAVTRADRAAPAEWGRHDLVVLDSVEPLTLPPGAYLLINTLGENLPVQIEGAVRDQVIRAVAATHPVMRLADLRGVRITEALSLRLQGGEALAEDGVPLVWAYEGRGIRAVLLPFALDQTDLPFHPGFPVLVANALAWLAGGPELPAGSAPVLAAGPRQTAVLLDPAGTATRLAARNGLFMLPPLDRVGLWRLRTDGWERRWVVSTVDGQESDLRVPDAPAGSIPDAPQSAALSLVPWLLGLGALMLAGEWLLWARTLPPDHGRRGRP
ncbi:MAG: VWA domain-containing protein [Armatimonadota bacterium]|nr:VWA domain-containing protein [Armatimonadota bacterium]MDR7544635.1 VWA domain-containing protein [Armatimonadota bacterium]